MLTKSTVGNAMAAGAVGFGAAGILAPRALARAYGLPSTPPVRFMARLWGTRNAALGALYLTSRSEGARRNMVVAEVAVNAADAVLAATASGVSARTRVMAAATSAAFAGAGVAILAGAFD